MYSTPTGALRAWDQTGRLTARLSLGGPFWATRGWPDVYQDQTVEIDTHTEFVRFTPFPGPG